MIRNARPAIVAVTRRISAPQVRERAASTAVTSDGPSSSNLSVLREAETSYKERQQRKHDRVAAVNGDNKQEKRLLKPHILSGRLTKLCEEGKLDEAVEMLKNMPLDAQNVSVWSTLVAHAGRQNRFQLAYQLHTEVRRSSRWHVASC